ncbi:hypothetical protein FQZ97_572100 [compost metagenome]
MAHSGSPSARRGSQSCFCSSVPPASRARERISGRVIRLPAAASEASDNASVTTIMVRVSSWPSTALPPYCSGIDRPNTPISRSAPSKSSGTIRSWRWIRSARGATTSAAKRRNWSWISDKSPLISTRPISSGRSARRLAVCCSASPDSNVRRQTRRRGSVAIVCKAVSSMSSSARTPSRRLRTWAKASRANTMTRCWSTSLAPPSSACNERSAASSSALAQASSNVATCCASSRPASRPAPFAQPRASAVVA